MQDSLEKQGLENALKQRELQVHTATETVRGLRDALARQSDANKHLVVAQVKALKLYKGSEKALLGSEKALLRL